MSKRARTDILYNTGGAIRKRHPGGRPRTYDEPRVKISLAIRKSQARALEELKAAERERLAAAGQAWQSITVTQLVAEAIDAFVAAHKKAKP